MKVLISADDPIRIQVDAVAVPVAMGAGLAASAAGLDRALGGLLGEMVSNAEFVPEPRRVLLVPAGPGIAARRVLLFGLGEPAQLDPARRRWVHQAVTEKASRLGYRRLAVLPGDGIEPAEAIEGLVMGAWDQGMFRSDRPGQLDEVLLCGFEPGFDPEPARVAAEATNRARLWQATPANLMGPETMAGLAVEVAALRGFEIDVMGPDQLEAAGYRLILAVGQGSRRSPRLVTMRHRGGGPEAPTLGLVGKGVCFDSGGLSLKPREAMLTMKGDMAGAAAVLAAMDAIGELEVRANVLAVLGLVENMPGGAAIRPGDVITSAAGPSVEIVNTDAEGRLVLADALTHARALGADRLVDVATLTAPVVLGHAAAVAMASDDQLWAAVAEAARQAGERIHRLPLLADWEPLLKSPIADLRNAYFQEAATATGGLFIQHFTGGLPWVHLDIAGAAWNDNPRLVTVPAGPLAAGTRTLIRLAQLFAGR